MDDSSISTCSSQEIEDTTKVIAFGGKYTSSFIFALVCVPEYTQWLVTNYIKELKNISQNKPLYFISIEEAEETDEPVNYVDKVKLFYLEYRDDILKNVNSFAVGFMLSALFLNIAYERYLNA